VEELDPPGYLPAATGLFIFVQGTIGHQRCKLLDILRE